MNVQQNPWMSKETKPKSPSNDSCWSQYAEDFILNEIGEVQISMGSEPLVSI